MYKLKIFNNIAENGLHILHESNFVVTNENPDAIMLRSEILKPESFNSELLNISSVNALLKFLEEPSKNTYFILIHNHKDIPNTLRSRCLEFKIFFF